MSQWPAPSPMRMQDTAAAPALNAAIRRHLGASLRVLYASLPAEPPDARIAALLAQLDKARP